MSTAKRALRLRAEVPAEVPRTAMIMAAGLGKRMRPLTATKPKPLIEVGGKALLDHVLEKLRTAGVKKVVVNVHYLADAVEAHLASRAHGLEVVISDERKLLMEKNIRGHDRARAGECLGRNLNRRRPPSLTRS